MAPQSLVLLVTKAAERPGTVPVRRVRVSGRRGPQRRQHPPTNRTHTKLEKPSIALVEDQQELLSTYYAMFMRLGWSTVFAGTNGEDLLEAARNRSVVPDIVIMDYRLPGTDGIDAARRLLRILPGVMVIITTADDSVRKEAEAAGLYFLQKPFSIAVLIEFLSRVWPAVEEGRWHPIG
jgi:CheY-like chemotaxis protein